MLLLIRRFVSTTDDDVALPTIVELEGSTSVTEAGGTDTFTVVLNAQPDTNVILSLISGRYCRSDGNFLTYLYVCELGYGSDSYCYRS